MCFLTMRQLSEFDVVAAGAGVGDDVAEHVVAFVGHEYPGFVALLPLDFSFDFDLVQPPHKRRHIIPNNRFDRP